MTFFMPRVEGGKALFIFPLHRAWSQLCGSLHEYAWNQIWHCPTPINNLVIWLELQKAPVHGLQNKRSLKTNKRERASFQTSLLFDWDGGFQHLGILLRVARGRVEGGKWTGLSMNGLACWQLGAVGVMVCEVTLYIGTVGSPRFFCKRSICNGGLGFRPPSHQSSQPILLFDSSVQGLTFDTQDPGTSAQTQAEALREGRRGRGKG